jgi:beta-glucanase (GH16 family)
MAQTCLPQAGFSLCSDLSMPKFTLTSSLVTIPFAVAILALSCDGGATLQPPPATSYTLVWSDEFNGADGSSLDSSKWTYDTGGKGWGNKELECYTNRTQNAQIRRGNLVITAQKENLVCSDGVASNYTSAR